MEQDRKLPTSSGAFIPPESNLELVVRTVRKHRQISKEGLVEETGLTATNLQGYLSQLVAEGLIRERDIPVPGSGGYNRSEKVFSYNSFALRVKRPEQV